MLPDLSKIKQKLVNLTNILEDSYQKESWVQRPEWITKGDFYNIVQINKDNQIVEVIINYIIEEYGHSYYANNILVKPIWLDDEKYQALLEYNLLEDIDKRNEKVYLLLKIFKNLYLMDYIYKSNLLSILGMEDVERLLDNDYTLPEYDLMREIISDFRKIYLDFAKVILKAKGLYHESKSLFSYDLIFLLFEVKDLFLDMVYTQLFFSEEATLVDCIVKCTSYYCSIKEKLN